MSLSRAAVCWLALVVGAPALAGNAQAAGAEAHPEAELVLPDLPPVELRIEAEAPSVAAAAPEVTGTFEPKPAAPVAAPLAAALDLGLPPVPEASVTFTLADQMAEALASRLADAKLQLHPRISRREREAMTAFYAIGGFKPLWTEGKTWTPAARGLIERLARAPEEGLDSFDSAIPALGSQDKSSGDLAEAELKLSAASVVYARDARGARIEPGRLSRLITPKLDIPGADAVLTNLASAKDPGAALAAYNPRHPGYQALKAKLAELRAAGSSGSRLEGDILANMERWRWMPAELGRRHILVNIPEYRLRVVDGGRSIYEARVIVGKPETPTPLFSDTMEHAIVNPSWSVPPSIFKNEFFSDPAYAASRGYEVVRTKSGISIRQPPGERNALGFVKFMFPNQHAVYLHDTPNRSLFGAERRAFSHGCVRLDQPFRFGQIVLGDEWTETRLRSLIGKGERTIRLPEKIPVHLAYFTVTVDDSGHLRQLPDLYAVNNKVRVALGLASDGIKVAEAPRPKQARPAPSPAARAAAREAAAYQGWRTQQSQRKLVQRAETVVRAPTPQFEPPFGWWVAR